MSMFVIALNLRWSASHSEASWLRSPWAQTQAY